MKSFSQVIPDNAARLIALRSGEIDIMDGLNPDDAAGIEQEESLVLLIESSQQLWLILV